MPEKRKGRSIKPGKRRRIQRTTSTVVYRRPTGEVKYFDTTKAATALASAGAIANSSLLLIQEGNTESTRVGNKITVKSVMVRGQLIMSSQADATATSQTFRIIVYLDKQCNGATAGVTDILQSASFLAFNNLDQSDRFITLAEEFCTLDQPGAAPSGAAYVFGESNKVFFLKKKLNLPVKFKGNAGTIADLASANIGVLVIGSTDALGFYEYVARVRYTDN